MNAKKQKQFLELARQIQRDEKLDKEESLNEALRRLAK